MFPFDVFKAMFKQIDAFHIIHTCFMLFLLAIFSSLRPYPSYTSF